MIVCTQCGLENDDRSVFCKRCHRYFRREERQAIVVEQTSPVQVQQPGQRPENYPAERRAELDPDLPLKDRIEENIYGVPRPRSAQFNEDVHVGERPSGGGAMKWVALVAIFLLVGAVAAFFMVSTNTEKSDSIASNLFVEAERLFEEENYSAALVLYQQFISQFPNNALVTIATEKAERLKSILLHTEEQLSHIKFLLTKSEAAIVDEKLLEPVGESALNYLNQVFELQPNHPRALELRGQIVNFFDRKALLAASNLDYSEAKRHFEKILIAKPGDRYALEKIAAQDRAIAQAEAERKLQEQRMKVERERQQLEASRNTKTSTPAVTEQRKQTSQQSIPGNANPQTTKESDRSQTIATNQLPGTTTPVVEPEAKSVNEVENTTTYREPVIEALLDTKKREYIHKSRVQYPTIYKQTKTEGQVLVEVTVGFDGRVEDYRVLKSDADLFADAAVRAIKQYRYKPGTQQNKPVRFKVVERIRFELTK